MRGQFGGAESRVRGDPNRSAEQQHLVVNARQLVGNETDRDGIGCVGVHHRSGAGAPVDGEVQFEFGGGGEVAFDNFAGGVDDDDLLGGDRLECRAGGRDRDAFFDAHADVSGGALDESLLCEIAARSRNRSPSVAPSTHRRDATDVESVALDELVADARELIVAGERRLLGITGAPGSGKSTLAEALVDALGNQAALVGLDGFHLSNSELRRLDRLDRKGAPDTFDAAGYVNLLQRLRVRNDVVVYAPRFDRGIEESLACAVPVADDVPLIVTEGNYLLVDGPDWGRVAGLLDACWYLDLDEDMRLARLMKRHVSYGRSTEEAHEHTYGSDQRNAELIAGSRHRSTRIIQLSNRTLDGA
jgi:pantothenate kinase